MANLPKIFIEALVKVRPDFSNNKNVLNLRGKIGQKVNLANPTKALKRNNLIREKIRYKPKGVNYHY